eukprot:5323941-Prymnesium_polylepis.3
MYYEHVALKLNWAVLSAGQTGMTRVNLRNDPTHTAPLAEGDCKAACDADPACKIYTENKPSTALYGDVVRCILVKMDAWASEVSTFEFSLDADLSWNTYSKYSLQKPPTWLHAPIHVANPQAVNADISTTRGDITPGIPYGRRLDGVY